MRETQTLDLLPLAMSYVPWQRWEEVYDEQCALERGTVFPSLDLPFTGGRCTV